MLSRPDRELGSFTLPPLLQVQSPSSLADYQLQHCHVPIPSGLCRSQWQQCFPSILWTNLAPLSVPTPFFSVCSQNQETRSIWDLQYPHLTGYQKHSLPRKPQQPHSPKNHKRQQKPRNGRKHNKDNIR